MSKELKNGFLDKDILFEMGKIQNEHKELYNVLKEINHLFYRIEKNYEIVNPTDVDLYVRTVFSQLHISFQTYIILLEIGLYDDSQVILRSMYDKISKCIYAIGNNDVKGLENQSIEKTLLLYEYIYDTKLYEYLPKDNLQIYTDLLKNKKKENGENNRVPRIATIFKNSSIPEAYIHYSLLSSYVHNAISVVSSKIIEDDLGITINQNIDHGDFKNEIGKMVICMQYVVDPVCKFLKLEKENICFKELVNKMLIIIE